MRVWALVLLMLVMSAQAAQEVPDVAVLIDVSGSMHKNDPHDERTQALRLLLNLLPAGSRFTLWTFADTPELIDRGSAMDSTQRSQALGVLNRIDAHGAWTDIHAALQSALHELSQDTGQNRHVILLTDGFVELGHGVGADKTSRDQVWTADLQQAIAAHVHIHSIALGGDADTALLRHLSLGSKGRFVQAQGQALTTAFLQIFDVAAPSQRVPVEGHSFSVDTGVRDMTLLAFRPVNGQMMQLMPPDQQSWTASQHPASVRWVHADQYDIVSVEKPLAGTWHLAADMGPDSRVSILSDMSLEVQGVPTNVSPNTPLTLTIALRNREKVVTDADFLMLTTWTVEAGKVGDLWRKTLIYDGPEQGSVMVPGDGKFTVNLPGYAEPGDYVVRVRLISATFAREFDQLLHVTGHVADLPKAVVKRVATQEPVVSAPKKSSYRLWLWILSGIFGVLLLGGLGLIAYVVWRKHKLRLAIEKAAVGGGEGQETSADDGHKKK